MKPCVLALALFVATTAAHGNGIPKFPLRRGTLELSGPAEPRRFLNAVGERSGMWGFESGRFEAWVYPLKIFRDVHLTFQLENSPEVYRGDQIVNSVNVQPHAIELLYSTQQFAVSQTIFAPRTEPGLVMLLDVKAPAPMRVQLRYRPELDLMWPAGVGGQGSNWNPEKKWIRLSEVSGRFSALIGSPAAVRSNATGYRPYLTDEQPWDVLELSIDPDLAKRSYIPVVIAGGIRGTYDAPAVYERIAGSIPDLYSAALRHYVDLEESGTVFVTPEEEVNEAMRWARVSLEQLKVCNPDVGCSYVSGYGSSGTGTRPMYAWFFDEPVIAAWSQLAYGGAEAVKLAFEFIRKYQREDGKIPHEVAQSAAYVDWFKEYPYAYIHPDSPLWYIVSVRNVWRFTGDQTFLRDSWPSIRKAYDYCLTILDSSDGLLKIPAGEWGSTENASFTKDAAMAGEWIAALDALAEISRAIGDSKLAGECKERAQTASASLERTFWNPDSNFYNYGVGLDGKPVTHLNPMIGYSAWLGALPDSRARAVLEKLSTAGFLSDWGQRNMSLDDPRYDEGSYQTGSVWPFMTAGPLLAHYRYHNAVQGLLTWRSMLDLRRLNARGAMPEALSGHVMRLLDHGVPHQMFSEHVAIPGLVNGILGLDLNVPARRLDWAPQLPPSWPQAGLRRFPFGKDKLDLQLWNEPGELRAEIESSSSEPFALRFAPALPAGSRITEVLVDDKPVAFKSETHAADVEVSAGITVRGRARIHVRYAGGVAVEVPWQPLLEGESSRNLRVLRCSYSDTKLEMTVEGRPEHPYPVHLHTPWRAKMTGGGQMLESRKGMHVVELLAPSGPGRKLDKAAYQRWTATVQFGE
jgi:hypothetical protein